MAQMSQVSKSFVKRIILPILKVWWSSSPSTSCQNPQMIDPRKQQPQKKHFFFFVHQPQEVNFLYSNCHIHN